MQKVLVLGGGISPERPISLRSAAAVSGALRSAGYEVAYFDPEVGSDKLKDALNGVDVVFPVLHGRGGEDGTLQAVLEQVGVPFVGSGSKVSAVCFDKWQFRLAMEREGILIPGGKMVGVEFLEETQDEPYVLKPYDGGSSIDTFIVRDPAKAAIEPEVFDRNPTMLYEQLITGTEITVGVLGGEGLPVIEIIPPQSGEFDYENKYNGLTQEICPAKSISAALQVQAQQLACKVHTAVGARHLSRVDIIVTESGELFVLELNTIPGMTDQSLFPKAAATASIPMQELVSRLVNMAIADVDTVAFN